jgi:hypothetical protein
MMASTDPASAIVSTFPLAFVYNVLKDVTWIMKGVVHGKGEWAFEQARYS